ncbi:spore coat associated protein CotJA [Paenibacillus sp. IHBB 10380]|uniref:spore coat associated protein CotJA n=1 Tax=Paenibacillus sp. IHBB 10380 TaxID=1566358 RepID=UPI0009E4954F|nr:spore coat associated protein CotJA [Paenibacillus sp. IHBB 10380]
MKSINDGVSNPKEDVCLNPQERRYKPFVSPFDPCPPLPFKSYVVPPNQYVVFQPSDLPQYSLPEALRLGTLWPAYYSPYTSRRTQRGGEVDGTHIL